VVAATVTVALFVAAPALASGGDDESLASSVLATVDAATETASQSTADATSSAGAETAAIVENATGIDAGDQITTAVDATPGNVDVSVRVLSPGVDEPVHQGPATPVISPDAERDIATAPATDAEAASSDAEPVSEPASVNTNVAVRILSPGSNGEVTQVHEGSDVAPTNADGEQPAADSSAAEEDRAISVEPDTTAADGTMSESQLDPTLSENNSDGYRGDDSQYQSESVSSPAPWYWSWWFGIDCDGNATTSSTETGNPASLDWTWEWVWVWSCTEEGVAPAGTTTERPTSVASAPSGSSDSALVTTTAPSSTTGNTNVSVRVLSPGDNGTVSQTGSSSPAGSTSGPMTTTTPAGEPWDWSWTFTFCDATTALANQGASGTPLRWTWEWTWNWSCDSAVGPPPDLSGAPPEAVVTSAPAGTDVISTPVSPETLPEASPPVSEPRSGRATVELQPPSLAGALRTLIALAGLAGLDWPRVDVATAVTTAIVAAPQLPGPLGAELSLPVPSAPAVDVSVVVVAGGTGSTPPGASLATAQPAPSGRGPGAPGAREWGHVVRATAHTAIAPSMAGSPATWRPTAGTETPAASTPTVKRPTVRPAPPDRARSVFSPLGELGSSRGSGAGTSGGLVPSAPVVAVAALTALFVLVAPGLGRRIRVARGLSPRAAYRSSIDHPG